VSSYNKDLDSIQRRLETDFAERIAAAEGELQRLHQERADALESVVRLRRALSSNGLRSIEGLQLASFTEKPVKTLTEAVRHVIREFIVGDFDINTVIGLVNRHHPEIKQPLNPTSVSGILRSLWDDEVLLQVKPGAGPKPAIYRLTETGRQFMDIQNRFVVELEREG